MGDVTELSNVVNGQANDRKTLFRRLSSVGRMVVDRLESDYNSDFDDKDEAQMNSGAFAPKKTLVESKPRVMKSINGSSAFMTTIYERLDEWEEPELQDEYETVSGEKSRPNSL